MIFLQSKDVAMPPGRKAPKSADNALEHPLERFDFA